MEKLKTIASEYSDSGMVCDTSINSLLMWLHYTHPEYVSHVEDIYKIFIREHTI